ncbi:MAG: PilZ domain-containing protein [Gemmataceae bacterium]|nr:PilZ domain-containing protein [Gemmataceae bacterium]
MFAFDWLPDWAQGAWLVPVAGLAACGLAFVVGRRMLAASKPEPVADGIARDDDFLQGVTRDRRGAPRRKGNTIEVQVKVGDEARLGWVLDRSVGGLCVLVERPVAEGSVVRLRPRQGGESIPWTEATVRSCRPEGEQHELGCQFHRTPNWAQMLQFG